MRFALGPTFSVPAPAPGEPIAATGKADVAVTVQGVDGQVVTVTVPAYDLASHNHLREIRAYLVPEGHGVPADAAGFVSSSYPFGATDVSANQAGVDAPITLPAVDAVPHLGQIVLGFDQS